MQTKQARREKAEARQEARAIRTDVAQIKDLKHRPGQSIKEITRLAARS